MDLKRTFKFKYSEVEYEGIPIIAANMDTVGTFEMAKSLSKVSWRPVGVRPCKPQLDMPS